MILVLYVFGDLDDPTDFIYVLGAFFTYLLAGIEYFY